MASPLFKVTSCLADVKVMCHKLHKHKIEFKKISSVPNIVTVQAWLRKLASYPLQINPIVANVKLHFDGPIFYHLNLRHQEMKLSSCASIYPSLLEQFSELV